MWETRNRSRILLPIIGVALLLGTASGALAGSGDLILGSRAFDSAAYDELASHLSVSARLELGPATWPVRLVTGIGSSIEDDGSSCVEWEDFACIEFDKRIPINTFSTTDVTLGVSRTFRRSRAVRPYLGAGVAYIDAEIQQALRGKITYRESDSSTGTYIDVGVRWMLSRSFSLGLDIRSLMGTSIELRGIEGDLDSRQVGLLFGWSWGADVRSRPTDGDHRR